MLMRSLLLLSVTVLTACSQVAPPFAASASFADEKKGAEPKELKPEPVTLTVPLDPDVPSKMAKAIGGKTPGSVELSLDGVKTPKGWKTRTAIRVFLNNPDATANTSPKDPSFVFAFHLSAQDGDESQNIGIDLGPTLALQKWEPGQKVRVTFVLVPETGEALPKDVKVPFEKCYISVPERP